MAISGSKSCVFLGKICLQIVVWRDKIHQMNILTKRKTIYKWISGTERTIIDPLTNSKITLKETKKLNDK